MTFPKQTPEYLAAKAPLKAKYDAARAPFWKRYWDDKEITHEEYCVLIHPAWMEYANALEPIWVKHGGTPGPKIKPLKDTE